MATIGVMDSGSGGLSVLREILRILPKERYIYFSDNANCPYGEKSVAFITDRCRSIVSSFLKEGADAVVIACNTATAAAIQTLRKEFSSIPIIGMEPAIKPAALGTKTGIVGVLATAGTLKAPKYIDTRNQYAKGIRVIEKVGKGFVELVESLDLDSPHAKQVVSESLQPLLDEGADTIVLGCTHYPFLLPLMEEIAPKGVQFIDPAPAVSRQLLRKLGQTGIDIKSCHVATKAREDSPNQTTLEEKLPANLPRYNVILQSSGDSSTVHRLFILISR